jgi:hypothetical protein
MKIRNRVLLLLAGITGAILAGACLNPLDENISFPETGSTGTVRVIINPESARTLVPADSDSMVLRRYDLEFITEGKKVAGQWVEQASGVFDLEAGIWNLSIAGYAGVEDAEPITEGSAIVPVSAGTENSVSVSLRLIGQGVFSYADFLTVLEDRSLLRASLTLTSLYDNEIMLFNLLSGRDAENPGTIALRAGYYTLSLDLYGPLENAGKTDVVHIYAGKTTAVPYQIDDLTFIPTASTGDGGLAEALVFIMETAEDGDDFTILLKADEPAFSPVSLYYYNPDYSNKKAWTAVEIPERRWGKPVSPGNDDQRPATTILALWPTGAERNRTAA